MSGPDEGAPVILLHGFPDDPRTWDGVVAPLAGAGYRTIVPYLRGYGPTRFLARRHAPLRPASRAGPGPARSDGRAQDRARGPGWIRLGRTRRLRGGGLVAGARPLPGVDRRLQCPERCQQRQAGAARPGVSFVVPVVLQHRARTRGAQGQPPRTMQTAVAALVAQLALRRRDLRAHSGLVRQSRLRRCRDPFVSASIRLGTGRSGTGSNRGATRGDA